MNQNGRLVALLTLWIQLSRWNLKGRESNLLQISRCNLKMAAFKWVKTRVLTFPSWLAIMKKNSRSVKIPTFFKRRWFPRKKSPSVALSWIKTSTQIIGHCASLSQATISSMMERVLVRQCQRNITWRLFRRQSSCRSTRSESNLANLMFRQSRLTWTVLNPKALPLNSQRKRKILMLILSWWML